MNVNNFTAALSPQYTQNQSQKIQTITASISYQATAENFHPVLVQRMIEHVRESLGERKKNIPGAAETVCAKRIVENYLQNRDLIALSRAVEKLANSKPFNPYLMVELLKELKLIEFSTYFYLQAIKACKKNKCTSSVQYSLFEFAKLIAKEGKDIFLENIHLFDFLTSKQRETIIFILANNCSSCILNHLSFFRLTDYSKKFRFAEVMARNNAFILSEIIFYMGFNITDRIRLAELLIDHHQAMIVEHFRNFEITDELVRKRLLLKIVSSGNSVPRVANFEIDDLDFLEKMFKIQFAKDPRSFLQSFDEYKIRDESLRIECARKLAAINGYMLSVNIKKFIILSSEARFEIAKLAFNNSTEYTALFSCPAMYVGNYELTDQMQLLELFDILLKSNFHHVIGQCARFVYPLGGVLTYPKPTEDKPHFYHLAILLAMELGPGDVIEHIFDYRRAMKAIAAYGNDLGIEFDDIFRALSTRTIKGKLEPLNEGLIRKNIFWLMGTIFSIAKYDELTSNWTNVKKAIFTIIAKTASIHKPSLRDNVIEIAWKTLAHKQSYELFCEACRSQAGKNAHFLIPNLMCVSLLREGIEPELVQVHLLQPIWSFKHQIKEHHFLEALLRLITYLSDKQHMISNEDLKWLIQNIFIEGIEKKEVIKRLNALRNIGELGGVNALSIEVLGPKLNNLDELLAESFRNIIPVRQRENFQDTLSQTFESCRDPTAIYRYAATLQTDYDPNPLLQSFGGFLDAVMDGKETYLKMRFDVEDHPQLNTIFNRYPRIVPLWKKKIKYPLDNLQIGIKPFDQEAIRHFYHTIIVKDKHHDLPLFADFLVADSKAKVQLMEKAKESSPAEYMLMQTTEPEFIELSHQDRRQFVNKIKVELHLNGLHLFFHDLNQFVEKFILKPLPEKGLSIEISHNPYDLLLCGKEIQHSCQSIDAPVYTSKGLLGYLHHGQIKLLSIKQSDGKIFARALLKLMWDEEKQAAVLMLSRIYPIDHSDSIRDVIIEAARLQAEKIGLPLVSCEVGYGKRYTGQLVSLGGSAPFEYSDECSRGVPDANGVYQVSEPIHYLAV